MRPASRKLRAVSRRVRAEVGILTRAAGLIIETHFADEIVTGGCADLIFLARELLREPYWALKAQHDLHEEQRWPEQYGYAVKRKAN
jgi:2,4-dienoyl-CoA reductase-like NADH-dependent reductase (Old Yellow Enzyme family)